MKNSYGLSREIPPDIALEIRQHAGFGCVLCGQSIIEYEHIDPEFKDATSHEASNITLLCPTHHAKVTRGLLSKREVRDAQLTPFCKKEGFSFGELDHADTHPEIDICGNRCINCDIPLRISGFELIEVSRSKIKGLPDDVTVYFAGPNGLLSFHIWKNEWKIPDSNYDCDFKKNRLSIKFDEKTICLAMEFSPRHGFKITEIDLLYDGFKLKGNKNQLRVIRPDRSQYLIQHQVYRDCTLGIDIV